MVRPTSPEAALAARHAANRRRRVPRVTKVSTHVEPPPEQARAAAPAGDTTPSGPRVDLGL